MLAEEVRYADSLPAWARWRLNAACRGMTTELFFPTAYDPPEVTERALAICARCPVRETCLAMALKHDGSPAYGIRGGMTANQRMKVGRRGGNILDRARG